MSAVEKTHAGEVLMKAFTRACDDFELTQKEKGRLLGVNASTLSRNAAKGFSQTSKQDEIMRNFIRVYRSLSAILGGNVAAMRHWFNTPNRALNGTPRQQVQTVQGLFHTLQYLDAMRAKI